MIPRGTVVYGISSVSVLTHLLRDERTDWVTGYLRNIASPTTGKAQRTRGQAPEAGSYVTVSVFGTLLMIPYQLLWLIAGIANHL